MCNFSEKAMLNRRILRIKAFKELFAIEMIPDKSLAKAQKELDAASRLKNAKKSFSLRKNTDAVGKKFVIVDDVITTGATVRACEELLYSAGAASVFVISIAKTPLRGKGSDREENRKRRPKNDGLWFND